MRFWPEHTQRAPGPAQHSPPLHSARTWLSAISCCRSCASWMAVATSASEPRASTCWAQDGLRGACWEQRGAALLAAVVRNVRQHLTLLYEGGRRGSAAAPSVRRTSGRVPLPPPLFLWSVYAGAAANRAIACGMREEHSSSMVSANADGPLQTGPSAAAAAAAAAGATGVPAFAC